MASRVLFGSLSLFVSSVAFAQQAPLAIPAAVEEPPPARAGATSPARTGADPHLATGLRGRAQ